MNTPEELDPLIGQAIAARSEGRHDEALALIQRMFEQDDTHFVAMLEWRQLAKCHAPARAALVAARDRQASLLLAGDNVFGANRGGWPRSAQADALRDAALNGIEDDQLRALARRELLATGAISRYISGIRPYTAEHLPAICRIYAGAKADELHTEAAGIVVTPLEQDAVLLAAFKESEVIVWEREGVAGFAATFDGQLRALFVDRAARGQGVGQALLDAVRANASGAISLNVARSNAGAIRFYERNGFVIVGDITKNYNGVDVNYLQMRSSMIIIRDSTEEDWQELKRIRLAALRNAPTAFGVTHASAAAYEDQSWRDRAAGRGAARFILAFDGAEAVGIVAHVPDAAGDVNLIAMWVTPALRGTATATQLVEAVQAHASTQAPARVVLEVAPDNRRAVAFYQKLGFVFLPEWEALASHPHIQLQKMEWRC